MRSFHGNFGVIVRAMAYILLLGAEGLRDVSENAVLNANYMRAKLKGTYTLPYDRTCMHEFVLSAAALKARTGVTRWTSPRGCSTTACTRRRCTSR